MNWLRRLSRHIEILIWNGRAEGELDEEIRSHLEQETEEKIRSGMSSEEARHSAVFEFGGIEQIKEQVRDARGARLLDDVLQDFRYAARMLAKSPGFSAAAIATLALAIGVNTAMFSLVNTAIFAPLPFDESEQLVRVFRRSPEGGEGEPFSYLDYLEYGDRNDVFEELAAFSMIFSGVDTSEGSESHIGQAVTGNYFPALGEPPARGRMLMPGDDETPGAHPVVVISYPYWQSAFGGNDDAVGQTITIGGSPYTIVGVAAEGFTGAPPVPSLIVYRRNDYGRYAFWRSDKEVKTGAKKRSASYQTASTPRNSSILRSDVSSGIFDTREVATMI